MRKKSVLILFLCLLLANPVFAQSPNQVEIFDISKGKVIKKVPVNRAIIEQVETILVQISDVYREFQPIPSKGYMIKVPLEPALKLNNQWVKDNVSEVILIFPEYENPHVMVFNDENKSFFFTFKGSVDSFLSEIKFIPKPKASTKNK